MGKGTLVSRPASLALSGALPSSGAGRACASRPRCSGNAGRRDPAGFLDRREQSRGYRRARLDSSTWCLPDTPFISTGSHSSERPEARWELVPLQVEEGRLRTDWVVERLVG